MIREGDAPYQQVLGGGLGAPPRDGNELIRVHVSSRLPGQEEVDEAFRQLGGASYSWPLILMRNLSHPST